MAGPRPAMELETHRAVTGQYCCGQGLQTFGRPYCAKEWRWRRPSTFSIHVLQPSWHIKYAGVSTGYRLASPGQLLLPRFSSKEKLQKGLLLARALGAARGRWRNSSQMFCHKTFGFAYIGKVECWIWSAHSIPAHGSLWFSIFGQGDRKQ